MSQEAQFSERAESADSSSKKGPFHCLRLGCTASRSYVGRHTHTGDKKPAKRQSLAKHEMPCTGEGCKLCPGKYHF